MTSSARMKRSGSATNAALTRSQKLTRAEVAAQLELLYPSLAAVEGGFATTDNVEILGAYVQIHYALVKDGRGTAQPQAVNDAATAIKTVWDIDQRPRKTATIKEIALLREVFSLYADILQEITRAQLLKAIASSKRVKLKES